MYKLSQSLGESLVLCLGRSCSFSCGMVVQSGKERTLPDGQTVYSQKPGHPSNVTAALEEVKRIVSAFQGTVLKKLNPFLQQYKSPTMLPRRRLHPYVLEDWIDHVPRKLSVSINFNFKRTSSRAIDCTTTEEGKSKKGNTAKDTILKFQWLEATG